MTSAQCMQVRLQTTSGTRPPLTWYMYTMLCVIGRRRARTSLIVSHRQRSRGRGIMGAWDDPWMSLILQTASKHVRFRLKLQETKQQASALQKHSCHT